MTKTFAKREIIILQNGEKNAANRRLDLRLGSSHYPSKFAQPRPRFTVLKRRPLKNPLAARWKVQLMQGQSVKAALHNAFKSWAFCILLTCPFISRLLDDLSVFYGLFEWEKEALHCSTFLKMLGFYRIYKKDSFDLVVYSCREKLCESNFYV